MKRRPALRQLSREHHGALVLALRIAKAVDTDAIGHLMATVPSFFTQELEPHFRDEETNLLPGLAAAGAAALVDRTLEEHRLLRGLADGIAAGDAASLTEFARALRSHVMFEEHELFATAEMLLPAELLDAAPPASRTPSSCRLAPKSP
jgi:hemerythrin-like domain-containing protein